MLHGWTGDESSMWVFGQQLPVDALVIAPRAPYLTQGTNLGGYSWVNQTIEFWPTFADFLPMTYKLRELLGMVSNKYTSAKPGELTIIGFSQGAAMAVAYALQFPTDIKKLGILSGFLPDQTNENLLGEEKFRVFIGHGEFDEIVPVEKAEDIKKFFSSKDYDVTYCVTPVGHRLGSDCARGLKKFIRG
jgi:phospholipase/carboxylesterase